MRKLEINALLPDNADGFINNIEELVEEYQNGNIQCLMLCFRRKEEESTRTFFFNQDDPYMFKTLVRLEHDMLGLCDSEASIKQYDDDEE